MKRRSTYDLEYSASGTQWLTYATGMYTGKSPTGPFVYSSVNPVLRKTGGVVTGTAHGSVVPGPDGKWWRFYTISAHALRQRPTASPVGQPACRPENTHE